MPFPFPTPEEAAAARANAGPLQAVGSTILRKDIPYVSPIYNIAGTLAHIFEGTTGQYGKSPSLLGGILSLFNGNPGNFPGQLGSDSGYPNFTPGGSPSSGQVPSNPYSFPMGQLGSDTPVPANRGDQTVGGAAAGGPQQFFNPYAPLNSYLQGTSGGYGGGSPLQLQGALRDIGINSGINPAVGGDTYSSPWQFAPGGGSGIPIGFGGVPLVLQR